MTTTTILFMVLSIIVWEVAKGKVKNARKVISGKLAATKQKLSFKRT